MVSPSGEGAAAVCHSGWGTGRLHSHGHPCCGCPRGNFVVSNVGGLVSSNVDLLFRLSCGSPQLWSDEVEKVSTTNILVFLFLFFFLNPKMSVAKNKNPRQLKNKMKRCLVNKMQKTG